MISRASLQLSAAIALCFIPSASDFWSLRGDRNALGILRNIPGSAICRDNMEAIILFSR